MRLIGLTGGIASGKSTVSRMLADRGAVVVDADRIAREVVEPGRPAHAAIVGRFGREILLPGGGIDRPALAAVVFRDPEALAELNAITHPEVLAEMAHRIETLRSTDACVVVDVPLLVESGATEGFDAILVVTAGADQQVERLARDRAMREEDARARIAAQASDEAKRAAATHVIENIGSLEDLETKVDAFWRSVCP